jgi:hypothetical protein
MTTLETLKRAREHLFDPGNWNRDGNFFKDNDKTTRCCCALGALMLFDGSEDAFSKLQSALPADRPLVSLYNDYFHTTHADILALFDRAIASVEATS